MKNSDHISLLKRLREEMVWKEEMDSRKSIYGSGSGDLIREIDKAIKSLSEN